MNITLIAEQLVPKIVPTIRKIFLALIFAFRDVSVKKVSLEGMTEDALNHLNVNVNATKSGAIVVQMAAKTLAKIQLFQQDVVEFALPDVFASRDMFEMLKEIVFHLKHANLQ